MRFIHDLPDEKQKTNGVEHFMLNPGKDFYIHPMERFIFSFSYTQMTQQKKNIRKVLNEVD